MGSGGSKRREKKSETKDEICPYNEPVPLEVFDKIRKSVCKVKYTLNSKTFHGTGFFMEYKSNYYLLTNYHVLPQKVKNSDIEIEIWNKTTSKFNLNNRFIKYLKKPKDITIIQIHQNEFDDIIYLKYDLNYINGYSQYINNDIISVGYPNLYGASGGSGKIKEIVGFELFHNIPTKPGSSGSPIILYNLLTVNGIHKAGHNEKNLNIGTFIGELIREMDSEKKEEVSKTKKKK